MQGWNGRKPAELSLGHTRASHEVSVAGTADACWEPMLERGAAPAFRAYQLAKLCSHDHRLAVLHSKRQYLQNTFRRKCSWEGGTEEGQHTCAHAHMHTHLLYPWIRETCCVIMRDSKIITQYKKCCRRGICIQRALGTQRKR